MKTCSTCLENKDDLLFRENRNQCKICFSEKRKQYRINNKLKVKENKKDFYIKNRERIKEASKLYYENNLDKRLNNLRPLSAKQNWLDGLSRSRHGK